MLAPDFILAGNNAPITPGGDVPTDLINQKDLGVEHTDKGLVHTTEFTFSAPNATMCADVLPTIAENQAPVDKPAMNPDALIMGLAAQGVASPGTTKDPAKTLRNVQASLVVHDSSVGGLQIDAKTGKTIPKPVPPVGVPEGTSVADLPQAQQVAPTILVLRGGLKL